MLPLGHMGIGIVMLWPLVSSLSVRWVFLGTLLPDLIDKPLFYGATFLQQQFGFEIFRVPGTRTAGHTGIFLFLIMVMGFRVKSAPLMAISLGMVSHLILDVMGDSLELFDQAATAKAILYPFLGTDFSSVKPPTVATHLADSVRTYYVWTSEVLGSVLLAVFYIVFMKKRPVRRES